MPELLQPCLGNDLLAFVTRCGVDPLGPGCEVFDDPSRVPFVAQLPLCEGFSLPVQLLCDSPKKRAGLVSALVDCMRDTSAEPDCFLYANMALQNAIETGCPGIHAEAQGKAERDRVVKAGMIAVAGLGGLLVLFKVMS